MKIAVIGGTGLQDMPDVELIETHQIKTEYSENRIEFKELEARGNRFFFLGRHGSAQRIPPHLINYRANLSALAHLGVDTILAVTAVGGISANLGVGDLVVPDQIIDYTWGRESTFFDGREKDRRHIDFTYPYSNALRKSLVASGAGIGREIHDGGTYACTQGPRLETAAEIKKLQADGATVVGMTGMPEAALARELNMEYAALSVVVNPAAGLSGVELSETDIEEECRLAAIDISALLLSSIGRLRAG